MKIAFCLKTSDGDVVDEASEKEPLSFTFGDGSIAPCLEICIQQLKTKETQTFLLTPEYAFGHRDIEKEQLIKKSEFPTDIEVKEGAVVEFITPTEQKIMGMIDKINNEDVFVDFNHPLAGHDLIFEVTTL